MPIEEIIAANGQPTLRLTRADGTRVLLHSARNPSAEAERWADAQDLAADAFVLFGCGKGYSLEALAGRLPAAVPVLVIDPIRQPPDSASGSLAACPALERDVSSHGPHVTLGRDWSSVWQWSRDGGLRWNRVALLCAPGYGHAFPAEFGRIDTLLGALRLAPDAPARCPGLFAHAPGTSVVVSTYNRPAGAAALVRQLQSQEAVDGPIEVLVVNDNGSTDVFDAVAGLPRAAGVDVRCFDTHYAGYGLALARNVGIRFARFDTVVFLDDDLDVGGDLLASYQRAGRGLRLGRVDFRVASGSASRIVRDPRGGLMEGASRPVADLVAHRGFLYGGNFAVDTDIALAVGGFDEAFLDEGEEDMDFGARVMAATRAATTVPEARAIHDGPTLTMAHDLGLPTPPQRPGHADERIKRPGRGPIVNGGFNYWLDGRWSRFAAGEGAGR
jgi:hypothetical protein